MENIREDLKDKINWRTFALVIGIVSTIIGIIFGLTQANTANIGEMKVDVGILKDNSDDIKYDVKDIKESISQLEVRLYQKKDLTYGLKD